MNHTRQKNIKFIEKLLDKINYEEIFTTMIRFKNFK